MYYSKLSAKLHIIFKYLSFVAIKNRIFVVFSALLAAVSVALTLYIPKLIGYAVDEIIG